MTNETTIDTISKFIEWIESLDPNDGEMLYRGLSSTDYNWNASIIRRIKAQQNLNPSLNDMWIETDNLIDGARRQGYDREPTGRGETPNTGFSILARLQHYGAATPLMDFTHNPLVALWFACKNDHKDGRIIVIAPANVRKFRIIDINNNSISPQGIEPKEGKLEDDQENLWRFNPPGFDARILAQNSEFILGKATLEESDILAKCVIAKGEKENIRQKLKHYGISEERLFRDFVGYAQTHSSPPSPAPSSPPPSPAPSSPPVPTAPLIEINAETTSQYELREQPAEALAPEMTSEIASKYYNQLGINYLQRNQIDAAISNFNKAIDLNPNYAIAYNSRGYAYNRIGEYSLAIADYNKAIKIKPNYGDAYINRGDIYRNKGEYDRAITDFSNAIKINPNDAIAYINRGNAYRDKGEYDLAIADFNETIKLKPNFANAYNHLGYTYRNKGEYDHAINNLNKAIEINPNYANAYGHRGCAYNSKGEYDRAIDDFNNAIELNPNDVEAYVNRGIAYDEKGEYDHAIDDFNKAIELNPNIPEAYYNRGLAKKATSDYKAAKKDFQTALQLAQQQGNTQFAEEIQKGIEALPADSSS